MIQWLKLQLSRGVLHRVWIVFSKSEETWWKKHPYLPHCGPLFYMHGYLPF